MEAFDVNRSFEVLLAISFMAVFVERGLAPIFESQYWLDEIEKKGVSSRKNLKVMVAIIVSIAACYAWGLDALTAIYGPGKPLLGTALTGLVVAGGAKGSMTFFRDWLQISSRAKKRRMADEDGARDGAQQLRETDVA